MCQVKFYSKDYTAITKGKVHKAFVLLRGGTNVMIYFLEIGQSDFNSLSPRIIQKALSM